jgi:ATP-dependent RNA helicase RhlE
MTFDTLGLHPDLVRAVRDLNFTEPTPIQREAIPPVLAGHDLLATAMTGSGKTAGFLLPVLHRLLGSQQANGPRVLVLTPTRELAAQVASDLRDLARHTRLRGAAVFGGVGMTPQERAFRRGTDVLVATPGRLLDHLSRPYGRLDSVDIVILDEADRMLDMGFLPDVRRVLRAVPRRRQTLLFSATMPRQIAELARDLMKDPVTIALQRTAAPATGIRHSVYPVAQNDKSRLLLDVLARPGVRSVLAFTRTKHRANRLAAFLENHGVAAARLHGNRSQSQREQALAAFKSGKARILVATDIAARGIDIEELSHVVNFDVPKVPEDYIHRVGRTARAGCSGDALTFVAPDEKGDLHAIEKALGRRIERAADGAPAREHGAAPRQAAPRQPARRPERPAHAAHAAHAMHPASSARSPFAARRRRRFSRSR